MNDYEKENLEDPYAAAGLSASEMPKFNINYDGIAASQKKETKPDNKKGLIGKLFGK